MKELQTVKKKDLKFKIKEFEGTYYLDFKDEPIINLSLLFDDGELAIPLEKGLLPDRKYVFAPIQDNRKINGRIIFRLMEIKDVRKRKTRKGKRNSGKA